MKKVLFSALSVAGLAVASIASADMSYGTCYAYTTCFNRFGMAAGTISCQVSGNAAGGVACQWFVSPGNSVSCQGYAVDMFGRYGWVSLADNCARFY